MTYTEFRKDGWPLCPCCGEDELFSSAMMNWNGDGERPTLQQCLDNTMICYRCGWDSRQPNNKRTATFTIVSFVSLSERVQTPHIEFNSLAASFSSPLNR